MPKINAFTIENFKGIKTCKISLDERTDNPVITLIGLNESGKTTILEAISHFVSKDNLVASLFKPRFPTSKNTDLIPIQQRAAFSNSIKIEAAIEINDDDIAKIISIADEHELDIDIDIDKIRKPFIVGRVLTFEDSELVAEHNIWPIDLYVRKSHDEMHILSTPDGAYPDFWTEVIENISEALPSIAYFPTFLVDIPSRIYLNEHSNESQTNRHYRGIIQSLMEGIDGGLDLKKHVCDRIERFSIGKPSNWPAQFMSSQERLTITSVFNKASRALTTEVIGGWRRVFSRDSTAREITLEWSIDTNKENLPYASFVVSDGESNYEISERSLGFRWFFSFLLFTAFKGETSKPRILIFDEPAANLHAKAQAELLKSFERIAVNGTKIIYSTHSHHMINPKWLNGAYIVENTAVSQDSDDIFKFTTSPTNIIAKKYKEFVSDSPSRSSYFQPVIERLQYTTPNIIGEPPFVLVEGISDYYALKSVYIDAKKDFNFRLLPGTGSSACGPLISLMLGRGEDFIILLDDDEEGKSQRKKYIEEWHLDEKRVLTIADLDIELKGKALEGLLDPESLCTIKNHFSLSGAPKKKQIGLYFSEICTLNIPASEKLSHNTTSKIRAILEKLDKLTSSTTSTNP